MIGDSATFAVATAVQQTIARVQLSIPAPADVQQPLNGEDASNAQLLVVLPAYTLHTKLRDGGDICFMANVLIVDAAAVI